MSKLPETPRLLPRASTDVSGESSPIESSLPAPRSPTKTLADVFPEDDPTCPSPPRKNGGMEIGAVHERMRSLLLGMSPAYLEAHFSNTYKKLCYLIGQDLDKEFAWGTSFFKVAQLLIVTSAVGERFQVLYNARGDALTTLANEDENETFQHYVNQHFPEYMNGNDAKHFTIFGCLDHQNMEPFYRFQLSGNCFLHAPILMHWYLTLWYGPTKDAAEVPLMHLSRYVRNKFEGNKLYRYLFHDYGGRSLDVLCSLMKSCTANLTTCSYTASYEIILGALKKYGPGLVTLNKLPLEDFSEDGKFRYEAFPREIKKTTGHAMLLVGIRQDENNQTFFLLQNWWKKQFIEVRSDYLSSMAGTQNGFWCVMNAFESADDADLYSELTGGIRRAQSSPLLERQYHHGVNQR
jgi:hypothetical protein